MKLGDIQFHYGHALIIFFLLGIVVVVIISIWVAISKAAKINQPREQPQQPTEDIELDTINPSPQSSVTSQSEEEGENIPETQPPPLPPRKNRLNTTISHDDERLEPPIQPPTPTSSTAQSCDKERLEPPTQKPRPTPSKRLITRPHFPPPPPVPSRSHTPPTANVSPKSDISSKLSLNLSVPSSNSSSNRNPFTIPKRIQTSTPNSSMRSSTAPTNPLIGIKGVIVISPTNPFADSLTISPISNMTLPVVHEEDESGIKNNTQNYEEQTVSLYIDSESEHEQISEQFESVLSPTFISSNVDNDLMYSSNITLTGSHTIIDSVLSHKPAVKHDTSNVDTQPTDVSFLHNDSVSVQAGSSNMSSEFENVKTSLLKILSEESTEILSDVSSTVEFDSVHERNRRRHLGLQVSQQTLPISQSESGQSTEILSNPSSPSSSTIMFNPEHERKRRHDLGLQNISQNLSASVMHRSDDDDGDDDDSSDNEVREQTENVASASFKQKDSVRPKNKIQKKKKTTKELTMKLRSRDKKTE